MSLLFRGAPAPVTRPRREQRSTVTLAQLAMASVEATSGMLSTVDPESAMRHDAVWSCTTRISQDVSMMPVDVVRYVAGTRQPIDPIPQIIAAPSSTVDDLDWRYQVVMSWLRAGNAWGLVTRTTPDQRYPLRIELQDDANVRPQMVDGRMKFFIGADEHDLWPVGDLWHVPAYTMPGTMIGLSPIAYHAASITSSLNAGRFGANFFVAGGIPVAIITVDRDPGETESKKLKQRILELTQGNREPLILPSSAKYETIQVNPNDSQFIDLMRFSVEQICRIYGEDPADHGSSAGGTAMTYANRKDTDLAKFKRRQFWVTKLQRALTNLLPRPQVVKLNTSATLMMTDSERHELHKLRLEAKTITVNEVRRIEDEPPFTDPVFDVPGIPATTSPAEEANP